MYQDYIEDIYIYQYIELTYINKILMLVLAQQLPFINMSLSATAN